MKRLGFVIMASGWSRRFGKNKLLEKIAGKPMISYTFHTLSHFFYNYQAVGSLSERIQDSDFSIPEKKKRGRKGKIVLETPLVVTRFKEVELLGREMHFSVLMHEESDQSDTIRVALSSEQAKSWDACMFLTGDQPLLSEESLKKLVDAFSENPDELYRLSYQEEGGNPVIFPKKYFENLRNLTGDHGGGVLLKSGMIPVEEIHKISVEREFELWDVDTEEAILKMEQLLRMRL